MSTPNGAKKDSNLRRTLIVCAVIIAAVILIPLAIRGTQKSQRGLDRSLQGIQRSR